MVVWLKRIVSYITVFIAIGYLVYTTIKAPVDLYQYMILLLLILISTTFIMDEDQKWRNIENDLKNIVSEISPTQIRFFDNSSDWVDAMELLVKNGKHTVDTASLDSSTRTKSPNSRSRIWNHITDCCKNENIKFRHNSNEYRSCNSPKPRKRAKQKMDVVLEKLSVACGEPKEVVLNEFADILVSNAYTVGQIKAIVAPMLAG